MNSGKNLDGNEDISASSFTARREQKDINQNGEIVRKQGMKGLTVLVA